MRHLSCICLCFCSWLRQLYAQTPTLGLNAPQLYEKGMNSLMGVGDQPQ